MSQFDSIRPFHDSEVNGALCQSLNHPMMKALMNFSFPDVDDTVWQEQLKNTHSISDFQRNFIYKSMRMVIDKSSDGLSTSGFEQLDNDKSYMFISNHRDIILDTSLLNTCLLEHDKVMTASAIGDNLVKKSFLLTLSRLNRNFVVQRGLPPRELLQSSKTLAEYIRHLLMVENQSVWIAQREGRTKDGNDATHQGVLKMLAMACGKQTLIEYFKQIRIVPVSISYEYDPTDALKMPQLLAEANQETYIKEKNEDFVTLLSGIMGQKKRIHIHVDKFLDVELDRVAEEFDNPNKQIQAVAQVIDDAILRTYKLWPTNYIAYDLLNKTDKYASKYTESEKMLFERRLELRIDENNPVALQGFLSMYANPVVNQLKYADAV